MKTLPPKPSEIPSSTPPPTTSSDPWSIEAQVERDVVILETILERYAQRRDKLELRGGRVVGIRELVDALRDRADICCLFTSEQRSRCTCGCEERGEVCEKFNRSLE